ncbi:MAG: transporter substrate-binding domain-containing protein [Alphaproteobacteria bacterium]
MKYFPLLAAIAAAIFASWAFAPTSTSSSTVETTFQRVLRTGQLRCGYYMFKPMTWKDPATGEMKGMAVDFAHELEIRSGIKLVWAEEAGFGTIFEGLKTKRYDAICTPAWPDGRMARAVDFGRTWFFSAIIPVVKESETRLTSVTQLNSPDVTITSHEGDADEVLAKTMFPKAKQLPIPPSADTGMVEMNLFTGKADVVLTDVNRIYQVNPNSSQKLKALSTEPLQLFPLQIAVNKGDEQLNAFLNTNVEAMLNDGTMERILKTHEPGPNAYLRVAKPYQ